MMNSKHLLVLVSTLVFAGGAPAQLPVDQLLPDEPFGLIWRPNVNGDPRSIMVWGAVGAPGQEVSGRYFNESFLVNGAPQPFPPFPYSLSGPAWDPWGIGSTPIGMTGDVYFDVVFLPNWEIQGQVWTTVWGAGKRPRFRSVQASAKYEQVQDVTGAWYDLITTLTYSRFAQDLILRGDYPASVQGANDTSVRVKVNGAVVSTGTANTDGQLLVLVPNQNLNTGDLVEVEIIDGVVGAGATILSMTIQ